MPTKSCRGFTTRNTTVSPRPPEAPRLSPKPPGAPRSYQNLHAPYHTTRTTESQQYQAPNYATTNLPGKSNSGTKTYHSITKATVIQHKKKKAEIRRLYKNHQTCPPKLSPLYWSDSNHVPPPYSNFKNNSFLTLCYFQGYLLYGYGGKKLYEYSVFKPLEGYFK